MTEQTETNTAEPVNRPTQTKAVTVQKLLSRAKGATLREITTSTNWQSHSARAFLTGLRKKGKAITRECRPNGETSWRLDR